MPRLLQHRLDPASRLARLMFAEYGIAIDLEDIKPWTRDPHLLELNPAATVPILIDEGEPPAVGVLAVVHAIEDRYSPSAADISARRASSSSAPRPRAAMSPASSCTGTTVSR